MKPVERKWTVVVVCAAALAAAYCLLQPVPPPAVEPLPHPNGYIDLVVAGKMLSGDPRDLKTVTAEALGGFVASNRAALDRVRVGLSRQCRVPTEYSEAYASRHIDDVSAAKQIALVLAAEGRLAELENHPVEAATDYLTAMKLGVELERGGMLIDALVAIACESIGAARLAAEVPKLTVEQSRALAREVEDLEAGREPMEKIMEQEHAFGRGISKGIGGMIQRVVTRRMLLSLDQRVVSKYNQNCRGSLELEASLAAHAFELEKGRAAKDWNDLVPEYLQRIPLDPGTTSQLAFSIR